MSKMDQESCLRSISVCESSNGSVLVKGETSDSVSKHVLVEQQVEEGNEAEKDTSTHVSGSVTGESDASTKEKAEVFHVIDLSSCGGESDNGQSICRICHLGSPDRVSGKTATLELIEIGCKCKNELGRAHFHCAEAWFKLRGNSVCEICGCTANNVTVSLTEEEWSEVIVDSRVYERRRRGSRQSCCILIVFMLTIILLHWLFKLFSTKPNE